MKHYQYLDHSPLLTCVLFLASNVVYANDLEFHGCWEPERATTYYADGHADESKPSCIEFYDTVNMVISYACLPDFKRREDDKITDADSASFSFKHYSQRQEEYAFRRKGDILVLERYDLQSSSPNLPPDKKITKYEIIRKFKNASSPDDCFPPQIIVTKDDVFRQYRILDLVISSLENTIRMEVIESLAHELWRDIPAPEIKNGIPAVRTMKDQDIRRVFEHVDRIASIAAREIRPRYEAQEDRMKDIFFAPGHYGNRRSSDLADENVRDYLAGAMEEVLQAGTITSYLMAGFPQIEMGFIDLKTLLPLNKVDEKRYAEEEKSAKEYGLGEEFLRERMKLMWILDIPVMQIRLPNGDRFPELKALSLRNAAIARKKNSHWLESAHGIERATMFTAQALWSQDRKDLMTKDIKNKMKEEARLLATRINMLFPINWSEQERKSRCSTWAKMYGIDLKSVEDGKGDWTKVRFTNGKGIAQGSQAHTMLSLLFEWGCAGTRDFKTARKILEDIAAMQNPITKDSIECRLAHGVRYGRGGGTDVQRAEELEAAYADRAGGIHKCSSKYPIDPSNPWADLK
jgi:hypothetical protein